MFIAKSSRSFAAILLSVLLIAHSYHLSAAVLTYDSCVSDSANSYRVGGWCFYIYRNNSWAGGYPSQDIAQKMCGPNGNLAVSVTYKMLNTLKTYSTVVAGTRVWLALISNSSAATQGWMWNTLLPNGRNATFPAIYSNIPWAPGGEPNNGGGTERSGALRYDGAIDIAQSLAGTSFSLGVLCQFAPREWKYPQRGQGRFAVAAYQIAQSNIPKINCFRQCHHSPFCVSMAYSPTTSDCQIYAVSPEDPSFKASVTADSAYNFYIRDGMEY